MSDPSPAAIIERVLPESCGWSGRPSDGELAALPNRPAVFLLVDADGAAVQLGTTQQLRRLCASRLLDGDEPRRVRADLAEIVRGVRWRGVACAFEATWQYYRLARILHPRDYRKIVSFGPAWFLHVDASAPLPELRATDQIWRIAGEFLGPWPTQRAAQQALETLWDLFDLCRHPEQYRRAPRGLRCAYADMGRCDAPCDGSTAPAAMIERSRAAWNFACGDADAWLADAASRMAEAARRQRFELAGQIKQQIAAASALRQGAASRYRDSQMRFVVALPATRRAAWKLLLFRCGTIVDGPLTPQRKLAADAERWIAAALAAADDPTDDTLRMEQTWLIARLLEPTDSPRAAVVSVADGDAQRAAAALCAKTAAFHGAPEATVDESSSAATDSRPAS